ncbi:Initiation-specific alpha-1,6-mannosyltransferase [Cyphellophora attinorum]|uniref:Initiation-specific alpha-1,6-mannosyltransferase n=1 Tax=Cyphellophora attinorum TaxID=1664694 RepID=A0A0N0NRP4_9EURO|nr:Initiation-specific alpha-1,6-mannosyltransferase [Phialophora attinorum]KPI45328.1 Initiation-specific alpha-1,6-mannosyltransferase [Phialophora attinorum]
MTVRRRAVIFGCMFAFFFVIFFRLALPSDESPEQKIASRQKRFPLVWEHIHQSSGHGGAWYIPPHWLPKGTPPPANITHAATLAAAAADSAPYHLSHTSIPRIIHQAWKSTNIEHFPAGALPAVEAWLRYATESEPEMAYFMWDDEGIFDLMGDAEPKLLYHFEALPQMVEKADVFRIVVCNSVGGVYGDIDTHPLRAPQTWVDAQDIRPWTDTETNTVFATTTNHEEPVKLIFGIEADTEEDSDTYWRHGYHYPVQLTQWALAGAANHPVLNRFLANFRKHMDAVTFGATSEDGNISQEAAMQKLDPIMLTGPAAVTEATKNYLAEKASLRWQALSGLQDGGRTKLVLDTLILPITGFSPGRGKINNMGSKPFSDPAARLRHDAQGSWKHFDIMVELGKTCRTLFGGCRDWSTVPG